MAGPVTPVPPAAATSITLVPLPGATAPTNPATPKHLQSWCPPHPTPPTVVVEAPNGPSINASDGGDIGNRQQQGTRDPKGMSSDKAGTGNMSVRGSRGCKMLILKYTRGCSETCAIVPPTEKQKKGLKLTTYWIVRIKVKEALPK